MQGFCLTHCAKRRIIQPYKPRRNTQMENVILQIPYGLYGKIATLAAAANMPIDGFVVDSMEKQQEAAPQK